MRVAVKVPSDLAVAATASLGGAATHAQIVERLAPHARRLTPAGPEAAIRLALLGGKLVERDGRIEVAR